MNVAKTETGRAGAAAEGDDGRVLERKDAPCARALAKGILAKLTDDEVAFLAPYIANSGAAEQAKSLASSGGSITSALFMRSMTKVQPEVLRWLWPGVIPAGKLTLIEGDPGLGKSLVTLDIAARVTCGNLWPDGSAACPIGEVILFSAEDDPGDTIRPRLDAAGAYAGLVQIVEGVRDGKNRRLFNLAEDVAKLESVL
jgi:hypothetical protein